MKLKEALDDLEMKQMFVDDAMNECEIAEEVVCKAMREARREKKLSLAKVAAKAGISVAYLSDIELGRRFPAYEVREKIMHQLLSERQQSPTTTKPPRSPKKH